VLKLEVSATAFFCNANHWLDNQGLLKFSVLIPTLNFCSQLFSLTNTTNIQDELVNRKVQHLPFLISMCLIK